MVNTGEMFMSLDGKIKATIVGTAKVYITEDLAAEMNEKLYLVKAEILRLSNNEILLTKGK